MLTLKTRSDVLVKIVMSTSYQSYSFPEAAVTNYCKVHGLNSTITLQLELLAVHSGHTGNVMLRQGLTLSRRPWHCHLSQFQQQHPGCARLLD